MKIAILGFGSVGQALARLLLERQGELYLRYGFAPRVVAIADSRSLTVNREGVDLRQALQRKRSTGRVGHPCQGITVAEIADKTGFDALVELTPTNTLDGEPARTHILEALGRGKHVVTANKGALALAFSELKMRAEQSGSMLRYSAAVGGGSHPRLRGGLCQGRTHNRDQGCAELDLHLHPIPDGGEGGRLRRGPSRGEEAGTYRGRPQPGSGWRRRGLQGCDTGQPSHGGERLPERCW